MIDINPQTRFRAVPDIELSRVPDGAVVYQNDKERVHFLNPTALMVFELGELGKSAGEIEAFLADSFGLAEPPTASVRECLASLIGEGLLVCDPSSAEH
jgi:hypothetical protein